MCHFTDATFTNVFFTCSRMSSLITMINSVKWWASTARSFICFRISAAVRCFHEMCKYVLWETSRKQNTKACFQLFVKPISNYLTCKFRLIFTRSTTTRLFPGWYFVRHIQILEGYLISARVSSAHCKAAARLAWHTSAAGVDLHRGAGLGALGTVLQLFTRYHLLRHIPLLLISNQFLQGYLNTWRGVRGS